MKSIFFCVLLLSITFISCKEEKLIIDKEKEFLQKDFVPSGDPFFGGWSLKLNPNGSADVLPGGDIMYRGVYKIKGTTLNVKTDQAGDFNFNIISEIEIKEKKYGVVMVLK